MHCWLILLLGTLMPSSLIGQSQEYLQYQSEHPHSDIVFTVPLVSNGNNDEPKRMRRSEGEETVVDITLPTPSEDIVLRLVRAESLLVPGATFEVRKDNISLATPVREDCYYQGKVAGVEESYAAMSLCNGLIGIYEYKGAQYSVQPVSTDEKDDNSQWLHSIHKLNQTGYEGMIDRRLAMPERDRRSKRDVAEQKYLEVMVVIDQTVIEFHGEDDTELFILALFNMVSL
ncbi:ADAM DEC1-like [Watersipora subatra]|uniref:ADAM DEC1-like n=1 Tax=Watersipora subatra TaxID=2589382 RepID=UPI00355BC617